MDSYTVYKHTNVKNGKVYIGITNQPKEKRWANGKGYSHCRKFDNAIKKYGWDAFNHEVVKEGITKEEAVNLEQKLIADNNACDDKYGYNLTSGGEHYNHSDETRKVMSDYRKSLKGKMPEHMREAIAEGLKGNTNHRISVSQYNAKTGELIATYPSLTEAGLQTGAKPCNISLACKGTIKLCVGCIWKYEDDLTPIDVNSHAHKYKAVLVEQYEKSGEFIASYSSLKEASLQTGADQSAITKVCKGKLKSAGGFVWKYAEK